MPFNKISEELLSSIQSITGTGNVLVLHEDITPYSHDETEDLRYFPEVVVKPSDTGQVSALLKLCNEHLIPVTARGGRDWLKRRRTARTWRPSYLNGKI